MKKPYPDSDDGRHGGPLSPGNWLSRTANVVAARGVLAYRATLMPLWRIEAARQKMKFCGQYIAVIGSCGKSTTSMLTSRLIGAQRSVKAGLFDNVERDVLRTLRKLETPVDVVVQEISEFPLGTIGGVALRQRPDCVIVTSIGLDHLTSFRTRAAVAEEMSALTRTSPIVCLNADDGIVAGLAASAAGRVVSFGRHAEADVRAENVASGLPGRLRFDLVIGTKRRQVETRFVGTLMLTNVLGALAAVHATGLDVDRAVATLRSIEPGRGRMSLIEAPGGHAIVLDTVKAPLWSTQLLVADLAQMSAGRRIFVLGSLSDTGNAGASAGCRQVLLAAAKASDLVIGIGGAESAASRLSAKHGNIIAATDLAAVARLLAGQPPATVVVKGNRLHRQHGAFFAELGIGGSGQEASQA